MPAQSGKLGHIKPYAPRHCPVCLSRNEVSSLNLQVIMTFREGSVDVTHHGTTKVMKCHSVPGLASTGAPSPAISTCWRQTGRPLGRRSPCTPQSCRRPAFCAS